MKNEIIQKSWHADVGSAITVLVLTDQKIYKGSLKKGDEYLRCQREISKGVIPSSLFPIPLTYISEIHFEERKSYLEVFIKGSTPSQIKILDLSQRTAVFDFFKTQISAVSVSYRYEEFSWFKVLKKPLIAFAILNFVLGWSYYVAQMIENLEHLGTQLVIILAIAGLGTKKILLGFTIINAILAVSMIYQVKNVPKKHILYFRKKAEIESVLV